MLIFEPHIHMFSRITDDYEKLSFAGVRAVLEPAFWLGQNRTSVGTFVDYFETLIEQGAIEIRSADEAAQFFRGMLMHQRYIEQLYLASPPPSDEEFSVHVRHVVDLFLEAYHQCPK